MKLLKPTLWIGAVLLAGTLAYSEVFAQADHTKVNLCHKTHSDTNPWVAQQVNANEEQSHLDNGDFRYFGPLADNGHPEHPAGEAWCADNVPVPPVTDDNGDPVVTPPVEQTDPTTDVIAPVHTNAPDPKAGS